MHAVTLVRHTQCTLDNACTSTDWLPSFHPSEGFVSLVQESPNFFVRGPHELLYNNSRTGQLTYVWLFRDMSHSTTSTNFSKTILLHYWQKLFAAEWNGFAGRSLEINGDIKIITIRNQGHILQHPGTEWYQAETCETTTNISRCSWNLGQVFWLLILPKWFIS